MSRTLFEKLWDAHVVHKSEGQPTLLYIDLHLVHEVTSPQAFEGLRVANRRVRRPDLTVATVDHNVPTTDRSLPIADPIGAKQINTLRQNCLDFGIQLFDINSAEQGIVHVIGPELGLTQPGMTIVCGDSHTSTHGAFGTLAFGIGTSEVEHVLATQCLPQNKPHTMLVEVRGELPQAVTAKDLALGIIGQIGTDGATGHVIEYAGDAVRRLSMEERMTLCNMSIEAGARAGMIAPDAITFAYLQGRRFAPQAAAWTEALSNWKGFCTDDDAVFDCTVKFDASAFEPNVTWGEPDASFVLNERRYRGASILVAGKNFGCGSSREHAPWALADYGFCAIIAPSFADIFANNCMKNGLLPVTLAEDAVGALIENAQAIEDYHMTVDLERSTVTDGQGFSASFAIDEFQRHCLIEGLDDIDLTLLHEADIAAYERKRSGID
jgi:3-isopropylmalate dehydratase large subunit